MKLFICALILLSAVTLSDAIAGIGRKQAAGAKGVLLCNGKPAANVLVKLYDDDRGLDTDDLLAKGKTDKDGKFEIFGSTREITTIDPKLNIYHKCGNILCDRKISIGIPDSYVAKGDKPTKFYDAGRLELSGKIKGQTIDCIH